MPLNLADALDDYGYVAVMAQRNPELKPLLDKAVKEEWDSARFERALADTSWFKRYSERQRAIKVQQSTDPATWQQTLNNKTAEVQRIVASLGKTGFHPESYWQIAQRALENEWSTEDLTAFIAESQGRWDTSHSGGLTGQAGEIEAHIRESYAEYGLPVTPERMQQIATAILSGKQTLGGMDNEIRNKAKLMFPQFAQDIDEGRTLKDIADPYVQTMANTLELPGTTIDLNDATIKKALQYKDPQGVAQIKPLWQFERELKDDSRWQYTKQAKNETYSVLQQVGKDWGFA